MIGDQRDGFGPGERWFWRALLAGTLLLAWYTVVSRPPLRPVTREPVQPIEAPEVQR